MAQVLEFIRSSAKGLMGTRQSHQALAAAVRDLAEQMGLAATSFLAQPRR